MREKKLFSKSKACKELEKKLGRERKQKSEKVIKEKLDKKKLDYDTISLILEVFKKSKFQWQKEHFKIFNLRPSEFRSKELPQNYRECVMLGVRLGTMRSKIIYNLRERGLTEKERQSMDDLVWNLIWHQWEEARTIHDFTIKELDEIKEIRE